ncbi:MAG: prenyltransferase [Deltaproteobacteria bacterium]|nr:prenyltransferase [Deltaproteobacteria bacterium]
MAALVELLIMLMAGAAPFLLGTLLADVSGYPPLPVVWGLGLVGVLALILSAFFSRECFAPGCGRVPAWGFLAPRRFGALAYISLGVAGVCGIVLQFACGAGDFTVPLGALGVLAGYFFFAPPLAWRGRGVGEAVGALSFGLLPVLTGYYLQTGHLITEILVYGLALTLAGFNLFLVWGLPRPGQESDLAAGTMALRLGPAPAALVYTLVNILTIAGLVFILVFPAAALPSSPGLIALMLLAVVNQELVKRRAYLRQDLQDWLVYLTAALHLGMCLVFALGLWWRR